MIQKIKSYLLAMSAVITLAVPMVVAPALTVAAATGDGCSSGIASNVASGAQQAGGGTVDCNSAGVDSGSIGKLASGVVNVFSVIVGAVAVIMIIYGGFRYITSGGDSGGVGNAKNTLIYAIVGLVIVALAQLIVHFVLNQATTAVGNSTSATN
jgi:hypothetical protein